VCGGKNSSKSSICQTITELISRVGLWAISRVGTDHLFFFSLLMLQDKINTISISRSPRRQEKTCSTFSPTDRKMFESVNWENFKEVIFRRWSENHFERDLHFLTCYTECEVSWGSMFFLILTTLYLPKEVRKHKRNDRLCYWSAWWTGYQNKPANVKHLWTFSSNYFSTTEMLHGIHPSWAQVDKAT